MDNHIARRRFGQNFLSDPNIINRIIGAIHPRPGENMVEIGPGLGALTTPLIDALGHLHVIEIDRDLIARLRQRHTPSELTIHEGDALAFDFGTLGATPGDLRVVGNLPYNISTPILFHLAGFAEKLRDMTFMLQKEVVMRMVAQPGTGEYGRLSVMLQYRFRMGWLFDVPPEAFRPAPKVTSSIVRLAPRSPAECTARDEVLFGKIVTAAFGQRRKTLRNTLKDYLDDADFKTLGLDPGERGERLAVARFIEIANHCAARKHGAESPSSSISG
ncbi:MAG: 16S rRNA (adenine(1518)-N(6)/adenine(1519)-N(6))-dimethyltransferase RsmA [Azoarcus sp.]|nr:16S rRNA (adenine(1518)-N(6)/adenine(1519)-N(6))-dimethyltransferase RsmA [Azoarcus sp.]